jgi:membrane-bound inhibitor of C-type lysozyme
MSSHLLLSALTLLIILPSAAMADEHYLCDDSLRLTAKFDTPKEGAGSVEIVFAGSNERIVLPQVLSADGGRYAAGGTEFWIKGKQATLTRGGKATTCKL